MKIYKRGNCSFKRIKEINFKNSLKCGALIGTIIASINFIVPGITSKGSTESPIVYSMPITTLEENNNAQSLSILNNKKEEAILIPNNNSLNEETNTIVQEQLKVVALSFDDGPSPHYTLQILDILKKNNCTATFFVLGNRVHRYANIVDEVYKAGNEIGNHSYNHSDFTKLSQSEIIKQFNDTEEAIYKITNEYPVLFRPPYGAINNNVKETIASPLVLWSIDSNDWRSISDEEVINNVISNLEDGKIILFHDIHKRTVNVCEIVIPKIKEAGYEIVSISELFNTKGMALEDGMAYNKVKKR